MGITSLKESFLKNKILWLLLSLIVSGVVMRSLSPPNKLDVRFWYSIDEAKSFLFGLSPHQVQSYLFGEIVDLWFMVNYSWVFYLILKKKMVFIVGVLDFFETILIIVFLISNQFMGVMKLLPMFSFLKWTTAGVIISLVVLHLVKKLRQ